MEKFLQSDRGSWLQHTESNRETSAVVDICRLHKSKGTTEIQAVYNELSTHDVTG